jgi:hypothetical protein
VHAGESYAEYDEFGFNPFGVDRNGVHKSRYPGYHPLADKEDVYSIRNMVFGAPHLDPRATIGGLTIVEIRLEILRLMALDTKTTNGNIFKSAEETQAARKNAACVSGSADHISSWADEHGRDKEAWAKFNPFTDTADDFGIYNFLISCPTLNPEDRIGRYSVARVLHEAMVISANTNDVPRNGEIYDVLPAEQFRLVDGEGLLD